MEENNWDTVLGGAHVVASKNAPPSLLGRRRDLPLGVSLSFLPPGDEREMFGAPLFLSLSRPEEEEEGETERQKGLHLI